MPLSTVGAGPVDPQPPSVRIAASAQIAAIKGLLHGIADPVRLGLVRCLSQEGEATVAELSGRCQASQQTTRRHLEALVISGLVLEVAGVSDGATPGRPAARFSLHPEARRSLFGILGPYPGD